MARVSHSFLDPVVVPLVPRLYRALCIPRWFPPEGIVVGGHLVAAGGGLAFAFSTRFWWAGLLSALAVVGNHLADMVDGTHARQTGQCRNGGELLDHFFDPLSFSYWAIGIGVSCGRLDLGLVGVLCIYTTAVLTSIKAKMTGRFTLARFGPTEFKALLAMYALVLAGVRAGTSESAARRTALVFFSGLLVIGVGQLLVNLVRAIREVNATGAAPDTSEWELAKRTDER